MIANQIISKENKKTIAKFENFGIRLFRNSNSYVDLCEKISLEVRAGEILGIIGESGCGKSITALALTGILPEPGGVIGGGTIYFNDQSVFKMSSKQLQKLRGAEVGVIFQEPGQALNPLLTIGKQLQELFEFHTEQAAERNIVASERIPTLLKRVGFSDPDRVLNSYPHELSGGMLQRVVIVMALLLKPPLIIADEPTTALDVTVQAQIMQLLIELKQEEKCAIILITHNMGLIAQYADRLAVMYAGRVVEESPVEVFLSNPAHPYSKGLLAAIPNPEVAAPLQSIPGQVLSPNDYDSGCRFRNRCAQAFEPCDQPVPQISLTDNHIVHCWLFEKNGKPK